MPPASQWIGNERQGSIKSVIILFDFCAMLCYNGTGFERKDLVSHDRFSYALRAMENSE